VAEETIVRTKRDGTITIADSGGSHTYTVAYEAGDLAITIPGPTIVSVLDRGQFAATPSLRYGDDQPCTFTFTATLRDHTDATLATLHDIINQSGYIASTWVSTLGANAEVFTVTLTWTVEGTDHGGADGTTTLNYCVVTGAIQEGDPTTISVSGTAYDLFPTVA